MIKTWLFQAGKLQTGGVELVDHWQQDPTAMLWMDLNDNEKPEEAALLESNFGLHPLAIQDAQRERHPPKIEAFENHTFILLKGLSADT